MYYRRGHAPLVKNWRILLEQRFTVRMALLTATSTFGLGRSARVLLNGVISLSVLGHYSKTYPPGAMWLRTRGHDFELPTTKCEFNKRNFIVRSHFIMCNFVLCSIVLCPVLLYSTHVVQMSYLLNSYLLTYKRVRCKGRLRTKQLAAAVLWPSRRAMRNTLLRCCHVVRHCICKPTRITNSHFHTHQHSIGLILTFTAIRYNTAYQPS